MSAEIKNRIFELLKEVSETKHHKGLLIVFSDLHNILARGAIPLGILGQTLKEFNEVCHINNENAGEILKKIGEDGAVLVDDEGMIYSPAVYLNVNAFTVDENQIEPEFCARHIAALATSSSTNSTVFTLSEETGKVREFVKGEIKKKYPDKEQEKILEVIEKDLKEAGIEKEEA